MKRKIIYRISVRVLRDLAPFKEKRPAFRDFRQFCQFCQAYSWRTDIGLIKNAGKKTCKDKYGKDTDYGPSIAFYAASPPLIHR